MNTTYLKWGYCTALFVLYFTTAQAQYFTYNDSPLATEQRVMLAENKPMQWAYRYGDAPLTITLTIAIPADNLSDQDKLKLVWGSQQKQEMALQLESMYVVLSPDAYSFGQYLDYFRDEEGMEVYRIRFRYLKGEIYTVAIGEIDGEYLRKIGDADNFNLTMTALTAHDVVVSYNVSPLDMPRMTVFASGGLRMRQSPDLNSKTLALIPDGTTVMVADEETMSDIYFEESPSTRGTLAVGDLQSKMMPVFHEGQLGYVYGGFLFPVLKEESADFGMHWYNSYFSWFCFDRQISTQTPSGVDPIIYQRRFSIDFTHKAAAGMDPTQRAYLLTRLFPEVWDRDALYQIINNPTDVSGVKRDGTIAQYKISERKRMADQMGIYTLYFDKGAPVQLDFVGDQSRNLPPFTVVRYVTASTLNMRSTLDTKSPVQMQIPFGAAVKRLNRPEGALQVIGGVQGRMVWVSYEGQEGTVFDAFLSPIAPSQVHEDYLEASPDWLVAYSHRSKMLSAFDTEVYTGIGSVYAARDIHQLLKTFRGQFPMLEDVSIQYNPATTDYTIRSNTRKAAYERAGNYHFVKLDAMMTPVIIIEELGDGLWFVTISTLEGGC